MKIKWVDHLRALFVLATVVPLILVAAVFIGLSYHDLKKAALLKEEKILSQARFVAETRMDHLKQNTRRLAQSNTRTLKDLLKQEPNLLSAARYGVNGDLIQSVQQPAMISSLLPQTLTTAQQTLSQNQRVLVFPDVFSQEGWHGLPIAAPSGEGHLVAVYNHDLLASAVAAVSPHLQFQVAGQSYALRLNRPFQETIRPLLNLFWRFTAAIVIIALLSVFLSQALLRKTKQMIAHKERLATLGQMASVVGHELKTGLAVIKNSLGFIQGDNGDKHINIIERQIKDSHAIVTNLLDLTRHRNLMLENVAINDVIKTILDELPKPPHCKLYLNLDHKNPRVNLDRQEFKRAFSNVLLNSFEALTAKGNRISVQTVNGGGRIRIRVEDDGAGISPDIQDKIKDPFFTTKSQGTGLGLAIAQKFADRHQGRLTISSRPGKGTRVELSLKGALT